MSLIAEKPREIADGCYRVPMSVMLDFVGDPFEDVPWDCEQFSRQDVLDLPIERACDAPYDEDVQDMVVGQESYHIARIAYLLHNGWDETGKDIRTPVLEIGFGGYRSGHPLLDGNHRYAAALLRGDQFFTAYIDGDIDEAEEMFGITA